MSQLYYILAQFFTCLQKIWFFYWCYWHFLSPLTKRSVPQYAHIACFLIVWRPLCFGFTCACPINARLLWINLPCAVYRTLRFVASSNRDGNDTVWLATDPHPVFFRDEFWNWSQSSRNSFLTSYHSCPRYSGFYIVSHLWNKTLN